MKVRDVMTTKAVEVEASADCQHAAQLMREHSVGTLVVATADHLIEGVITDRDLVVRCMALGGDPARQQVGNYMDQHPTTVDADLDLERAVDVMRNSGHRRLPVTERGTRVIGMVSLDDVAVDVKHYLDAFLAVAGKYSHKVR
jgi:CBS domain-containing protein